MQIPTTKHPKVFGFPSQRVSLAPHHIFLVAVALHRSQQQSSAIKSFCFFSQRVYKYQTETLKTFDFQMKTQMTFLCFAKL